MIDVHRHGPWELPEGWVWAPLKNLIRLRGEKASPDRTSTLSFVGMDDVPANSLRIETVGEFRSMKSAGNRFYPNDILYGRLRPYLNKVVVPEFEGVASGEFIVMSALEGIDPRYLQFFMHARRFVNSASADTSGDRPRIDFDKIAEFEIPLAPTSEQRRIVARIDELFTEIADGETALARARDDLDTWRRALLKAAVTGELTREWRELHKISNPWVQVTIAEAGELRLGRQRSPQHHQGEHMRPYLRVANVFEGRLDLTDVKSMNFAPDEFRTYQLKVGDILLNEGQSPELLGRPAIFGGEIEGCCFQNTLLRFRAHQGLLPQFALLVFRHYMRSGRFKREARITTNLAHLSQSRCASIEFPMPSTEEQYEIVRLVELLEEQTLEQFEHVEISTLSPLRQSILKAAFEGQLVEQDPRDEPAAQLLARLSEQMDAQESRSRKLRRAAVPAE